MPYDLAVTASLIRLAHRFPEGVEVSSDGWPEDWQAGLDLCRDLFGHAELPFQVGAPRRSTRRRSSRWPAAERIVDGMPDLPTIRVAGLHVFEEAPPALPRV